MPHIFGIAFGSGGSNTSSGGRSRNSRSRRRRKQEEEEQDEQEEELREPGEERGRQPLDLGSRGLGFRV